MKLNTKSITILIFTLLFMASCSNARYGHLTRRTKPQKVERTEHVVKAEKKDVKAEPQEEIIAQEVLTVASEGLTSSTALEMDVLASDEEPVSEEKTAAEKAQETQALKEKTLNFAEKYGTPVSKFIAKKTIDSFEKNAPQETNEGDFNSLLKLLLIILLILIIVDLIGSFLPPWIRGILGAIILIIIILWLISIL